MSPENRWLEALEDLRRQGRLRQLRPPCGVDFSSNDYLGYGKLHWHNVTELSRSGQASRLLRGHHEIWEEVETRLAAWHGAEAALMMTSGYVANEGVLSTIIESRDWAASHEWNHASLIDGLRLARPECFIYKEGNVRALNDALIGALRGVPLGRQFFMVTESYFGMDAADGAALPLLQMEGCPFTPIIDEAHATGCFGTKGAGLVAAHGLRSKHPQLVSIHTGGKALGVPGAYICCSRLLKDYLVNRCRHLIFTTALPPALGPWWLDAIERVQVDDDRRAALHRNSEIFRAALQEQGIAALGRHYIVPIVVGDDTRAVSAAEALQAQGFDVRAIRPPTVPQGTARLRISIHADHDQPTLLALAEAIAAILGKNGPTAAAGNA